MYLFPLAVLLRGPTMSMATLANGKEGGLLFILLAVFFFFFFGILDTTCTGWSHQLLASARRTAGVFLPLFFSCPSGLTSVSDGPS